MNIYIVIAVLALCEILTLYGWNRTSVKAAEFKAQIQQAKDDAERQSAKTLEDVAYAFNDQLPKVRDGAVAAYCRTHSCGVPWTCGTGSQAGSTQGADGTGQERVATDSTPDAGFIQDCADDALKVRSWQDWAKENQLPVK